jgi:hypothetical protein
MSEEQSKYKMGRNNEFMGIGDYVMYAENRGAAEAPRFGVVRFICNDNNNDLKTPYITIFSGNGWSRGLGERKWFKQRDGGSQLQIRKADDQEILDGLSIEIRHNTNEIRNGELPLAPGIEDIYYGSRNFIQGLLLRNPIQQGLDADRNYALVALAIASAATADAEYDFFAGDPAVPPEIGQVTIQVSAEDDVTIKSEKRMSTRKKAMIGAAGLAGLGAVALGNYLSGGKKKKIKTKRRIKRRKSTKRKISIKKRKSNKRNKYT